jgi:hypothetical protein
MAARGVLDGVVEQVPEDLVDAFTVDCTRLPAYSVDLGGVALHHEAGRSGQLEQGSGPLSDVV